MLTSKSTSSQVKTASSAATSVAHRSGAVAQMLQMPVATLRVWERRYGLTQHPPSPGGQRLYAEEDLRRLTLIKQLTDMGHPIGSVAVLDLQQLQAVALTHANTVAATQPHQGPVASTRGARRPWRLAVVGAGLDARLQRPSLLRRLGRPVVLLGPFDSLEQAAKGLRGQAVDTLLVHEPHLLEVHRAAVEATKTALAPARVAVLYGFAADAICEALADADVAMMREPQPDAGIAQWLHRLAEEAVPTQASGPAKSTPTSQAVPPRRWVAATLNRFASMSSTIACECPRHLAELLMQLHHFEDYSAACENRHTADAQLHAYLHEVAATSRALFETALERVALHEGLALPAPLAPPQDPGAPALRKTKPVNRKPAIQQR